MKGYPTRSGIYWVKMYEWNSDTLKYDRPSNQWEVVKVDVADSIQYQVQIIGSDEIYDVRHIYEYEEAESPA